jgi:hypothetical protein
MVNFRKEHIERTNAERLVAIQVSIDNHRLLGFRMLRDALDDVILALEMTVDTVDGHFPT